jgi:hypothetical protein
MLLNKIPEGAGISLRPDRAAAKTGVALRLERSTRLQGERQKAKPFRRKNDVREKIPAGPGDFAFHNLQPTALETFCHIVRFDECSWAQASLTMMIQTSPVGECRLP